jgi:predicted transposase/invertase (TIGR01784 family)
MLVDTAFKYFFANEKTRIYAEYLIDAIFQHNNDLLSKPINIQENKSITLSFFEGKTMIFDFIATNNERKINIESENKKKSKTNYLARIEAYASAIYLEKFQRGMDYKQLLKTTTISLVNYNLSKGNKFYTHHSIKLEPESRTHGKIEHYVIQIPKFRKHIKNLIKNMGIKKFIKYINNKELYKVLLYLDIKTDKKLIKEVIKMDTTLSELHKETESVRLNKEKSERVEEFLKAYKKQEQEDIDWNKVKEEGIEEGIEEGMEKGIGEGMEKGIIIGKEKGKEEGIKEIALNLKTKSYSLEEIKEITGLSIKEIESLSGKY